MAASLAPECNEIKEQYDSCFLKWYSEKYLRDSSSTDECEHLFKKYRKCMEKTLKERGIDTMLEEARKSNKDNGMDVPKKNCKLSLSPMPHKLLTVPAEPRPESKQLPGTKITPLGEAKVAQGVEIPMPPRSILIASFLPDKDPTLPSIWT